MSDTLVLWSHALAALLFAALALWAVRRDGATLPRWPMIAMLCATALWALALAGLGGADTATRLLDGVRNLAMLAFMAALQRHGQPRASLGLATVYGVVAAVVIGGAGVQLVAAATAGQPAFADIAALSILMRMMVGVAALMLVQTLWAAQDRADIRLIALGIALVWLADLNLASVAYLTGVWPLQLVALRGLAVAAAAAIIASALHRGDRAKVRMSRTIAYQSLTLVAIAGYFAILALVTTGLSTVAGASARIYQTALVFGSTAAVLTLASSPWLRAWAKVKIAKHLFSHRYDYRAEWLRFTNTLGTPENAAPLAERVVKAVADLTDSPAGLLLVADGEGLGIGTGWNWHGSPGDAGAEFARHLARGERIIELDPLRHGAGDAEELAAVPQWVIDDADIWAVVPLPHLGSLLGAILLARPALDRPLDWEDFDLLKVAGRQAASYLAEARAQDALAQGQRFDEFNRRFAFIVHDIKNLTSGLTLVARNAERHADNPEFRADMVATLQDSAAKLNALLARLSANPRGRGEAPVATPLLALAERIARARRATHPIVVTGDAHAVALADQAGLEQIVGHLLLNAIEASPATELVTIAVEQSADYATIAVIDRGCGMTPAFVRDELFRPFVSSKPAGFGIGAFEARQLTEAMGGRISVDSREGEGSTFRIILPTAADLFGVAA